MMPRVDAAAIARLRALAETATAGPYTAQRQDPNRQGEYTSTIKTLSLPTSHTYRTIASTVMSPNMAGDATWLAACDPQTITGLLDDLEEAQREIERLQRIEADWNEWKDIAGEAELEATNKALRELVGRLAERVHEHEPSCGAGWGATTDSKPPCTCGLDALLAEARAWSQPTEGGQ